MLAGFVRDSDHMHSAGSGSGVEPMPVLHLLSFVAHLSASTTWRLSLAQHQTIDGSEPASRKHVAAICSTGFDQPILAGLPLSFSGSSTCQFMVKQINYY